MPKKVVSPKDKNIIYGLHKEGFNQSKIASLYEISQSTVSNIIKDMKHEEEKYNIRKQLSNK